MNKDGGDFDGLNAKEENMSDSGDAKSDRSWSGQRKKENDEDTDLEQEDEDKKPEKKYGFGSIAAYYDPCSGWSSVIAGILASCIMPMFGFYFGNLIFVIMEGA